MTFYERYDGSDLSPSMEDVKILFNEFQCGCLSGFGLDSQNMPTTQNDVKKILNPVLADHRFKVCDIAATV